MASAPRRSARSPAAHVVVHETPEDTPPDLAAVERMLKSDAGDHACLRGPLRDDVAASSIRSTRSARSPQRHGKRFLIDCDERLRRAAARRARRSPFDAVAASSNKCIEGVPGLGFVICRKAALEKTKGNATTLVLDLHDQWQQFREDRPIPLHAADPCHRRLPPGARGVLRRGRRRRPRRALCRELPGADRRHARRSASSRCCPTTCRRRSSSPSACRRTRASCSRRSTTG